MKWPYIDKHHPRSDLRLWQNGRHLNPGPLVYCQSHRLHGIKTYVKPNTLTKFVLDAGANHSSSANSPQEMTTYQNTIIHCSTSWIRSYSSTTVWILTLCRLYEQPRTIIERNNYTSIATILNVNSPKINMSSIIILYVAALANSSAQYSLEELIPNRNALHNLQSMTISYLNVSNIWVYLQCSYPSTYANFSIWNGRHACCPRMFWSEPLGVL